MRDLFGSFVTRQRPRSEIALNIDPALTDLEKIELLKAQCAWPDLYYSTTLSLMRALNPIVVVEIGVAWGFHAEAILRGLPQTSYIGIDPYQSGYDPKDGFQADVEALFSERGQSAMDRLYAAIEGRLRSEFGDRASLLRSDSRSAMTTLGEVNIDVVFVDGNHTYEGVISDLESVWPKIRPGGLLIADDVGWPSVESAMLEYFGMQPESFLKIQIVENKYTLGAVFKGVCEQLAPPAFPP